MYCTYPAGRMICAMCDELKPKKLDSDIQYPGPLCGGEDILDPDIDPYDYNHCCLSRFGDSI